MTILKNLKNGSHSYVDTYVLRIIDYYKSYHVQAFPLLTSIGQPCM